MASKSVTNNFLENLEIERVEVARRLKHSEIIVCLYNKVIKSPQYIVSFIYWYMPGITTNFEFHCNPIGNSRELSTLETGQLRKTINNLVSNQRLDLL